MEKQVHGGVLHSEGNWAPNQRPMPIVETKAEAVNHPAHYGGEDNPYEVIKVAEAWGFDKDAYLFNALKYLGRCTLKGRTVEDLEKAVWYLQRKIDRMKCTMGEKAE